jgi:hypothetical protein
VQTIQTETGSANMYFPHPAEDELRHIAGMIGKLEQLLVQGRVPQTNVVMQPDYWRARINAVLTRPNLPPAITSHASALMTRLDVLSAALDRPPANRSP